ncbi:phasin family protein [Pseudomonas duriflava]|uniref:Phasin family protein n=1 Tax=Pseudomonas duriflava TaxID=459528 RepID=A0A562PUD7_9PSED|nr:phasin family protein [Pseudomonas duriflava]TWI48019.1 phasin family protein [Pseudomonas duriflava]
MSFFDLEKLQSLQKANLDGLQQLSSKMYDSAEALGRLQMNTLRAAADDNYERVRKLMTVRDPQTLFDVQEYLPKPNEQAERLLDFNRQAYDVFSQLQVEVTKVMEHQLETSTQHMQGLVEDMFKHVPTGAGPAVSAFKTAMETASSAYDTMQKTTRQATGSAANSAENTVNTAAPFSTPNDLGKRSA